METEILDAEIIEASSELVLTYESLVIESNIKTLSEQVDKMIAPFLEGNIVVDTKEDEDAAKAILADLNKAKVAIDTKRKEEVKKLSQPITVMDTELKGIVSKMADAYRTCKDVLDAKVNALKVARREELATEYLGIVGEDVAKLIPYCIVENPSWCTRSYGDKKAETELFAKAESILADMKTLGDMELEYRSEVIAHYTNTLDIRAAIDKDRLLKEQKAEAGRKAKEAQEAFKLKPAPVEPAPAAETAPVIEQAPDLKRSDYAIYLTGATHFEAVEIAKYAKEHTKATVELKGK